MDKKNNICVFDIKNEQEDYSYVVEFIDCLENLKFEEDSSLVIERVNTIVDKISVKGGRVGRGLSPIYYEKPFEKKVPRNNEVAISAGIENIKVLKKDMVGKMLKFFSDGQMNYHIRVHGGAITEINLVNFQYLALTLQKLEYLFFKLSPAKKRLSVFIVPESGDAYPFEDSERDFSVETYQIISHYLRLISQEYKGIIFCVFKNGKGVDISALDHKVYVKPQKSFPLIPMNNSTYKKIFTFQPSVDTIKELFSLGDSKKSLRFRKAALLNLEEALCDYIAETSYRKLQQTVETAFGDRSKEILDVVCDRLLNENINFSWFSFALFAFIVQFWTPENCEVEIQNAWEMAQNLYDGLRQIVQNAIQHSETNSCIFSFYVHTCEKDKDSYKGKIEALYEDMGELIKREEYVSAVEIFVSDLNSKQTIVGNFIENLKTECDCLENEECKKAYDMLINHENKIALRNLFSEFQKEDLRNEWRDFRSLNSSAHVGLLLFGITARRCNASVKVHSSTSYIER